MTIIATETFSNGIISMFKGEIREITEGDPEYTALLEEGLVTEYSEGGESSESVLYINVTGSSPNYDMDVTYETVVNAWQNDKSLVVKNNGDIYQLNFVDENTGAEEYSPSFLFYYTDADPAVEAQPATIYFYYFTISSEGVSADMKSIEIPNS